MFPNNIKVAKKYKTKGKNDSMALERANMDISKAMRVLNIITAAGDMMNELSIDKEKTLDFHSVERQFCCVRVKGAIAPCVIKIKYEGHIKGTLNVFASRTVMKPNIEHCDVAKIGGKPTSVTLSGEEGKILFRNNVCSFCFETSQPISITVTATLPLAAAKAKGD